MADYQNTELWQLFEEKASAEGRSHEFIAAVGRVCERGANLSKTVLSFFPTFTLHDETHLRNVSDWMLRLLGAHKNALTATDAAYLLMAAWCHDVGMAVSADEKKELLRAQPKRLWNRYFEAHFDAKVEFETKGSISDETLRDFVRAFHAERAGTKLRAASWDAVLTTEGGLMRETLIALCQSHGLSIEDVRSNDEAFRRNVALLRMADLLDYDASRAPADLFAHIGLDSPANAEQRVSRMEWDKTRGGGFQKLEDDAVHYFVVSDSLQLEKELDRYLDYAQAELQRCNRFLAARSDAWRDFALPSRIEREFQQNGYKSGEFHITMDQDRVLELLTGRNLYKNAGVFVRELLQNAIDAVLTRRAADLEFTNHAPPDVGEIHIDTWSEGGYDWFRIEDNGIGMSEQIVTDYFLKVGRSYYNSDEFRKDLYNRAGYTPISRFGIGILSCFMADPENTLLEVSTQRYSRAGAVEPAVRLDVEGLYGYYYLVTDETPGCPVKPMHHPKPTEEDDPFRSEPGTTICVRTKLRRLGKYESFREILDEYLLCPDVVVTHYAWNADGTCDKKAYLTQRQLMRMVHEKNPDGASKPPKEHCYPFPDELYREIKRLTPDFIWEKRPELVFRFYPLDWYDETGDLQGVAVYASVRFSAHSKPICFDGEEVSARLVGWLNLRGDYGEREGVPIILLQGKFSGEPYDKLSELRKSIDIWPKESFLEVRSAIETFYREYLEFKDDPQWIETMEKELKISRERFEDTYSEWKAKEEEAFELRKRYGEMLNCCARLENEIKVSISAFFWECVERDPTLRLFLPLQAGWKDFYGQIPQMSSCNGVVIPPLWRMEISWASRSTFAPQCCFALTLLSGAYRPELSLARDSAESVSPEAYYVFERLVRFLPETEMRVSPRPQPPLFLTSEQDFRQMLKRHPSWEADLSYYRYLREGTNRDGDAVHFFAGCSMERLQSLVLSECAPVPLDVDGVDGYGYVDDGMNALSLAVLKERFAVSREFNPRGFVYASVGSPCGGTEGFPPEMFFPPAQPCQALGYVGPSNRFGRKHYNFYNPEHPFSKWLIERREAMEQNPRSARIFRRLLVELLTEDSKTGVVKSIAAALDDLRQLPDNPFQVSDKLYVSEAELLAKSDFNADEYSEHSYWIDDASSE